MSNDERISQVMMSDGRDIRVKGSAHETTVALGNALLEPTLCALTRTDEVKTAGIGGWHEFDEQIYVNPQHVAFVRDVTPYPAPTKQTRRTQNTAGSA